MEIEATTDRPALLVLTDSYYPGWEARVDGAPAEIHRANGLYRAVVVPPGSREVIFEYRPRSFRVGAAISLAALGVLVATGVMRETIARHPPPAQERQRATSSRNSS